MRRLDVMTPSALGPYLHLPHSCMHAFGGVFRNLISQIVCLVTGYDLTLCVVDPAKIFI